MDPARSQALPSHRSATRLASFECNDRQGFGLPIAIVEGGASEPVLLRKTDTATSYAAAITDAQHKSVESLELRVANAASGSSFSSGMPLTNAILDVIQEQEQATLQKLDPTLLINTPLTTQPDPPVLVVRDGRLELLTAPDGQPFRLCRDDAILAAAGVPTYSMSAVRHLHTGQGENLVRATPNDDGTGGTASLLPAGAAALNPQAERITIARHLPLSLSEYIRALSGTQISSEPHSDIDEGWLLEPRTGSEARLREVLHLKIRLIGHLVRLVQSASESLGRPLLSLSDALFRVDLDNRTGGLPWRWMARPQMVDVPSVAELKVLGETFHYPIARQSASVFDAPVGKSLRGTASLRVRQVTTDQNSLQLDLTLVCPEAIVPAHSDRVLLEFNRAGESFHVLGVFDLSIRTSQNEWRLLANLPIRYESALRSAGGQTLSDCRFELLRRHGAPCDLYSLGVLAAKILFEGAAPIGVALDELKSIAGDITGNSEESATGQIHDLLRKRQQTLNALGPHRIMDAGGSAEGAYSTTGELLWTRVLLGVVRFFQGPAAYYEDFGSPSGVGLHRAFDRPRHEWDRLSRLTRALLFGTSSLDDEVRVVLDKLALRLAK